MTDQSTRAGAWIPAGWQIKRDQDWIAYQRPDGWTQSVTPHEPQHAHSQTLFMLLDAMLAAAPAAAPASLVPLTDEQIYDLNWPADVGGFDDVRCIVKEVERAHGIQAPGAAPE